MAARAWTAQDRIRPLILLLAFEPSIGGFVVLLVVGFLIGGFGHLVGSNVLVLVGIVIVFLATVLLPLLVYGNPY